MLFSENLRGDIRKLSRPSVLHLTIVIQWVLLMFSDQWTRLLPLRV